MTLSEMTENLQSRSQAKAFESPSTGVKPVKVKEEEGRNFKKSFRKPSEKLTGSKANGNLCNV